jgi:hypothetical protein
MSSYTTQLKTYIEMWSQDQQLTTREKIEVGRTKLFDFDYPIFDEAYRKEFETKFIRTFYFREIGSEVEGKWKFDLETWFIVNMPYFNKMFESELIEFDPLNNTHTDTTSGKTKDNTSSIHSDGTRNSSGNGTTTDDNFNRNINSNTPDGRLSLTANDGEGVIEYASDITENNENNSSTSTSEVDETNSNDTTGTMNETEDYVSSKLGKIGVQSYSKMVMEYRQSFLRIEKQIFEEMQQLFMLVY